MRRVCEHARACVCEGVCARAHVWAVCLCVPVIWLGVWPFTCVRACVRARSGALCSIRLYPVRFAFPQQPLTTPTVRESPQGVPRQYVPCQHSDSAAVLWYQPWAGTPTAVLFCLVGRAGGASDDLLRTCRPHEKLLRACYAVSHQQAAEEKVAQSIENATLERFGACDPRVPCSTTRVPWSTLQHPAVPLAAAA